MIFLSFDIGDKLINYGLCRTMKRKSDGIKILKKVSKKREESLILQIQSMVQDILTECKKLDGVVVLYESKNSKSTTHSKASPSFSTFEREILETLIPSKFKFPCIVLERRHAFAWWQFSEIRNTDIKDIVYLEIDDSIVSTIIANGQLITGHKGFAGLIGDISIRGQELYKQGTSVGLLRFFEMIFKYQISEEEFFSKLPTCEKYKSILDVYVDYLTEGLILLIRVLNPAAIVLGGALMARYDMSNLIEKSLAEKIPSDYWCLIKRAKTSKSAYHLGASLYLQHQLLLSK